MGLPLPGYRMAIVDDDGHEVETGTVGHIVMAPSAIGYYSLGYWDSPEGASTTGPGSFLTSGDLGRRDPAPVPARGRNRARAAQDRNRKDPALRASPALRRR
ncbi:MAG: hypothetical protein ACRDH5_04250 [bacterium]